MMRALGPRAAGAYEELRARVLSGVWAVGERLPSHDALAADLGVALLTVRQAIGRLEHEGLLSSEQGRGTFVRSLRSRRETAERSFRALVQASPLAIYSLDAVGHIRTWNRACENLFGWSEEEVIGGQPPNIPAESRHTLASLLEKIGQEGAVIGVTAVSVRKDGVRLELRSSAAPLYDDDGYVIGTVFITEDITEYNRLREAAEREAAEVSRVAARLGVLQDVTSALSGALTIGDVAAVLLDRGISAVGASAGSVALPADSGRRLDVACATGYPGELLDRHASIALDAPLPLAVAVRTAQPVWIESMDEYCADLADESMAPVTSIYGAAAALPLVVDGTIAGAVGLSFDQPRAFAPDERAFMCTLVDQCAQALDRARVYEEEQAQRMARDAIIAASPFPIVTLALDGTVTSWSAAAAHMLGCTAEEMVGRLPSDFKPEERGALVAALEDIRAGESISGFEFERRGKHGETLTLSLSAEPLRDRTGASVGAVAVIVDLTERKRAEEELQRRERALRESEERYRRVIDASPDAIVVCDAYGTVMMANAGAAEIFQCPGAESLLGMSMYEIVSPADRQSLVAASRQMLLEQRVLRNREYTMLRRDGTVFPAAISSSIERDADGLPRSLTLIIRDISEQKRSEDRLVEQFQFTAAITESIGEGVVVLDESYGLTFMNRLAERILGWSEDELIGHRLHDIVHARREDGSEFPECECRIAQMGGDGGPFRTDHDVFTRRDGSLVPVSYTAAPLLQDGTFRGIVVTFRDISERLGLQDRLRQQSLHDPLTGLANRLLLYERIEGAIAAAREDGEAVALISLDIDRFKELNDSLGHQYGDTLLRQIGDRLRTVGRATDTIARVGDDEFALLAPACNEAGTVQIVERILDVLAAPFDLNGQQFYADVSIGVALYPQHAGDAAGLIRGADVGVYLAKRSGTGYALYRPGQDGHTVDRLQLMSELREAIDRREMTLYFQPKMDMRTGAIVEMEALARWIHLERGLVPPGDFIPVAEQTGLIKPLTILMVELAAEQTRRWHRAGRDIPISVNISARNLQDPTLLDAIARILAQTGVCPGWLGIEVTETAVMSDLDRVAGVLRELRSIGLKVSIDDFGVGQTSLSYLKRLPADEIKIDRSFVTGIAVQNDDAFIVRSVIDLGHHLGLVVSAEGVETQQALDILAALGCDVAQGYYICHPLPAGDIECWMDGYTEGIRTS